MNRISRKRRNKWRLEGCGLVVCSVIVCACIGRRLFLTAVKSKWHVFPALVLFVGMYER